MALYRVYDLILGSNFPLPELTQASGIDAEFVFRLLPGQKPEPVSYDWVYHWCLPNGKSWLSFAKQGTDYLFRFLDLADFRVSVDGKDIRCYPAPCTPLVTVRHLLLDQVMPLVLGHLGSMVRHASAVVAPEGAIVFLGEPGCGKSTLTASFCQQGFPLLADDRLVLEEKGGRLFGIPSYPGLQLLDDAISDLFGHVPVRSKVAHYTEKKRLGLDNGQLSFCTEPVPIGRVYIFSPPDEIGDTQVITIAPLSPRDAFMELVRHAYRMDITDVGRLRKEFECLGRVAAFPRVCRLTFPRDFSLLPAIRTAILENLGTARQK
jgi:hypothetical protein